MDVPITRPAPRIGVLIIQIFAIALVYAWVKACRVTGSCNAQRKKKV